MTLEGGVLAMCEIAGDANVSTNDHQFVPEKVAIADSCQEDSPGSTDCSVSEGSAISIDGCGTRWSRSWGVGVATTRSSLPYRLDALSSSVTTGFGDNNDKVELAPTCPKLSRLGVFLDSWHHEGECHCW